MAGICEEFLFRGPLQTSLIRKIGPWRGILITSILFAAAHFDYTGMLVRSFLGFILGWVVWRTKSIFPAMLLHTLIDLISLSTFSWLIKTRRPNAIENAVFRTGVFFHIAPVDTILILIFSFTSLIFGIWMIISSSKSIVSSSSDLARETAWSFLLGLTPSNSSVYNTHVFA